MHPRDQISLFFFFFKTTIRHLLAKVASESGWSHLGFASLVNICLCILTQ